MDSRFSFLPSITMPTFILFIVIILPLYLHHSRLIWHHLVAKKNCPLKPIKIDQWTRKFINTFPTLNFRHSLSLVLLNACVENQTKLQNIFIEWCLRISAGRVSQVLNSWDIKVYNKVTILTNIPTIMIQFHSNFNSLYLSPSHKTFIIIAVPIK